MLLVRAYGGQTHYGALPVCLQQSRNRLIQIKSLVNAILQAPYHTTNTVGFKFKPLTATTREKLVGQKLELNQLNKIFLFLKLKQCTLEFVKCPHGGRVTLSSQPSTSAFKVHSVFYTFKEIFF